MATSVTASTTATASTPTPGPPAWQPSAAGMAQILPLFREYQQPPSKQQQEEDYLKLVQLSNHPEFCLYCVYIMSSMPSESEAVRAKAGLQLKNKLKSVWSTLPLQHQEYIRQHALATVGDPISYIRNIVGTLIAAMAVQDHLQSWPTLLETLAKWLDHNNPNVVDGALNALAKICEDMHDYLDNDELGRPLTYLIPKFISMFGSQQLVIRKNALGAVNNFLFAMPQALAVNMDNYMRALFHLTNDPSKDIRKRVCQAFVILLEIKFQYLQQHMHNVIRYMLMATDDEDDDVALEACEFWSAYCETKDADLNLLKQYLVHLVPILLKRMVYSEMDRIMMASEEEDDQHVPDRQQDMRPRFHTARQVSYEGGGNANGQQGNGAIEDRDDDGDDDGDDWDDEEEVANWNLRKCAAASLDTLANEFKLELLQVLLPLLHQTVSSQEWIVRESGILALGAIAEGCFEGIKPYLKDLIPYLIAFLSDQKPLVRSITCWTLSRYSKWVINEQDDQKYLKPLMIGLLTRVLDPNKKVQEAACSAFATLEEEAGERLVPYLLPILQNLMFAFDRYQAKNMLILYDAIGTLAEAVGSELNRTEYIQLLMPPLMNRWNRLSDDDRNIFPLLECLTSVATALGLGFSTYAKPVFGRCLKIIESNLLEQRRAVAAQARGEDVEFPDKEFMVCALDLLSGLAEGLEGSIESLVGDAPLILGLLYECIKDENHDVRQSAFALLGDLAKSCMAHLRPHLDKYIPIAAYNLNPHYISVCNNASWSIGEIAIKMGDEMRPYIDTLLDYLIPIINKQELLPSLLENTAITIGRLGLVCPQQCAVRLEQYVGPWCVHLARIKENHEKEHAFRGLCLVISHHPKAVLPAFSEFCQSIETWKQPNQEMAEKFHHLLHSFKKTLGAAWPQFFGRCPATTQQVLTLMYQL